MRSEYHISEDRYKTEEIMKVLAILDTNAYEVKMPDMNIQGAYKLASLAEHNCVPNAIKTTSSKCDMINYEHFSLLAEALFFLTFINFFFLLLLIIKRRVSTSDSSGSKRHSEGRAHLHELL
jgi:hypothetical protein